MKKPEQRPPGRPRNRPKNREVENEMVRPPEEEGEPPRPATEPGGVSKQVESPADPEITGSKEYPPSVRVDPNRPEAKDADAKH